MLAGTTDAALAKEEARIRLKREQNEKRKERFFDSRKRLIGVDVDALDAQVAEMHKSKADTKEADRIERIRQIEIERVLEAAAEEERMLKQFTINEVKRNWQAAVELKKNAVPETIPDPLESGASAAQNFAGNDPNKHQRIRLQQEQMRRWVQEQVAEKAQLQQNERDSSKSYSDMLKAIEEIRDVAEKEEQDMRKYLMRSVKEQNDVLAASRHKRWNDEKLAWTSLPLEQKAAATSIDLKDNLDLAIDETGRIVRKDAFRGFNAAQQRRILQENEVLLAQKRAAQEAERSTEDQWLMQQYLTQQAMEHANIAETRAREEEKQLNLAIVKQQMSLQQQKRDTSNRQRYGAIEPGFFDKFGNSCR